MKYGGRWMRNRRARGANVDLLARVRGTSGWVRSLQGALELGESGAVLREEKGLVLCEALSEDQDTLGKWQGRGSGVWWQVRGEFGPSEEPFEAHENAGLVGRVCKGDWIGFDRWG